jgi:hypothetical protein
MELPIWSHQECFLMRYAHVAPLFLRAGIHALESNRPANRATVSDPPSPTLVRITMETCFACQRRFPTSQGRKAHQKACAQYRERRTQQAALGNTRLRQLPQAGGLNPRPDFHLSGHCTTRRSICSTSRCITNEWGPSSHYGRVRNPGSAKKSALARG